MHTCVRADRSYVHTPVVFSSLVDNLSTDGMDISLGEGPGDPPIQGRGKEDKKHIETIIYEDLMEELDQEEIKEVRTYTHIRLMHVRVFIDTLVWSIYGVYDKLYMYVWSWSALHTRTLCLTRCILI